MVIWKNFFYCRQWEAFLYLCMKCWKNLMHFVMQTDRISGWRRMRYRKKKRKVQNRWWMTAFPLLFPQNGTAAWKNCSLHFREKRKYRTSVICIPVFWSYWQPVWWDIFSTVWVLQMPISWQCLCLQYSWSQCLQITGPTVWSPPCWVYLFLIFCLRHRGIHFMLTERDIRLPFWSCSVLHFWPERWHWS